ncbi:hypothetical protein EG328_008493 [Venturia inaequalis]|uniref:BTB domain-containing protein n=1 Tax=Venturia inaequalis TaxID=5025 RepID=A0A8H3UCA3_VENIN|nr:hypothetical protein EG328_008493 [Venturia inaequalis]
MAERLAYSRRSGNEAKSKLSRLTAPISFLIEDARILNWTQTAWIRVGTDPDDQIEDEDCFSFKAFTIHESVPRGNSPFFDKIFKGEWKEAQEQTIKMPIHDPEAFETNIHWIYSRRIETLMLGRDAETKVGLAPSKEMLGNWLEISNRVLCLASS